MGRRQYACLGLMILFGTAFAPAQTLDEILARNQATRGGSAAFEAIRSARFTGTMTFGSDAVPMTLEFKRPDKRRMAVEIQGSWGLQAYDGEEGWEFFPFFGSSDPHVLPADQLQQFQRDTDLVDGPLLRALEKGYTIELDGVDRVEGTDAFKLKVTSADGSVFYSYLDTDHCLEFKRRGVATIQGRAFRFEVTLGNYKKVGCPGDTGVGESCGIFVPHLILTSIQGQPQEQVLRIEAVELNVTLDDARFSSAYGAGQEGG